MVGHSRFFSFNFPLDVDFDGEYNEFEDDEEDTSLIFEMNRFLKQSYFSKTN